METPKGMIKGHKIHRLSGIDAATAEELLKVAAELIVPDDQRQRLAFIPMMPHLYVMRRKGCSWGQLAKVLNEAGFNLQPSSVRTYYGEELAVRQDLCEARLAESLLAIAAAKKSAFASDRTDLVEQLKSKSVQAKAAAAEKINAMFGTGTAGIKTAPGSWMAGAAPAPATPPGSAKLDTGFDASGAGAPRPPPSPPPAPPLVEKTEVIEAPILENKKTGLRPETTGQSPVDEESITKNTLNSESPSPGVTPLDDDPIVPVLKQNKAAAPPSAPAHSDSTALPRQLVCQKLQDGVTPLARRPRMDENMYLPVSLEHPAIPGLFLTLEQRLYGAYLEYTDASDGVIQLESPFEKRFRVKWMKPIPPTISSTDGQFTKMRDKF
ncbi:hypothetical protein RA876_19740 (plasmid) [Rhodoferax antarcticus]|nr:hypothetical protein RA876_19310 [Rhodoferax antarcticus]APW48685.1 hypothetical protein RA876_19740 [Rhodoferax antarcticus]